MGDVNWDEWYPETILVDALAGRDDRPMPDIETFVVVTDLCGRVAPQCVPLSMLDERDDILDMLAEHDTDTAYLGEYEYRIATDAERDAAMDEAA